MAQSSPVGFLVPLNSDLSVDGAAEQVPILPGTNSFGRNNLGVVDRRVSRHHIILHASEGGAAELAVEGANPVVIRCGGEERKKLSPRSKAYIVDGDVLELIPGRYFFRYVLLDCSERSSCSRANTNRSQVEACSEEVWRHKRRKHDVEEDTPEAKSSEILVDSSFATIRHSRISDERSPAAFRLLQVKGIPSWANSSAVGLQDVVQGNVIFAVLSNYMVDIDWLLSECPFLEIIPRVLVIHGESGASLDIMKMKKPSNWVLHRPPLPISYGTHHSKAMLLVYPHGLRVIIHTANLIYVDWNNKTQALWMQDFPLKNDSAGKGGCPFENDLVDYLNSLKWPELNVSYESIGQARINPSFFRRFDFSCAMVRLVASVPGYHTGSNLKKWGHMKLRSTLENFTFDDDFKGSSLVYQFSSLGSLDEKWLSEFASSLSSGVSNDKSPLGPGKAQIIWPTVEDVRCSLEGYAAGSAIPSPMRNVEKEFLKKYWVRWKATQTGRCRAMPHIKSYTRYSGQRLAWFLLTSANLSKAAWGALQKNNSQLFIRSYELGVLFLPMPLQGSHLPASFSCTDDNGFEQASPNPKGTLVGMRHTCLVTLSGQKTAEETDSSDHVITLPVPYELPPRPYTSEGKFRALLSLHLSPLYLSLSLSTSITLFLSIALYLILSLFNSPLFSSYPTLSRSTSLPFSFFLYLSILTCLSLFLFLALLLLLLTSVSLFYFFLFISFS